MLQKLLKNKYEDLDTESEEESSSESEPDSVVPTVVGTGNELSKKLRALYSDMIKFKNPQGIEYIEMFMERPSKKLYPDYYAVIKDPMDMKTINERIKADMYKTVEDFMQGQGLNPLSVGFFFQFKTRDSVLALQKFFLIF